MTNSRALAATCLRDDGELALYRSSAAEGALFLEPVRAPSADLLQRLENEFALRDQLDAAWAACPLHWDATPGRSKLWLADPGGELLSRLAGQPWAI
jgi:hypothetical protein